MKKNAKRRLLALLIALAMVATPLGTISPFEAFSPLKALADTVFIGGPNGELSYPDINVGIIPGLSPDFYMGADISSFDALWHSGVTYRNRDGTPMTNYNEFFALLADAGLNYARIRVFNDPYYRAADHSRSACEAVTSCPMDHAPASLPTGSGYSAFPGRGGTGLSVPVLGGAGSADDGMSYGGGNNDLATAIRLGLGATSAGMKTLVNFHYSDFWADPGARRIPKAWRGLNQAGLEDAIYNYTYDSLKQMLDAGVDVGMVQTGNEHNSGIAGQSHNDNGLAMYAHAMAAIDQLMYDYRNSQNGCDPANLAVIINGGTIEDFHIKKAIHRAEPNSTTAHRNFSRTILGGLRTFNENNPRGLLGTTPGEPLTDDDRVDFEIVMASYYEQWHGQPSNITNNLNPVINDTDATARGGSKYWPKEIVVAETSYPYALMGGDGAEKIVPSAGTPTQQPITIQGQANAVREIIERVSGLASSSSNPADVNNVPTDKKMGTGVFYWEPAWLPINQDTVPLGGFPAYTKAEITSSHWSGAAQTTDWQPNEAFASRIEQWNTDGTAWATKYAAYYGRNTSGTGGTYDEGLHWGGNGKDNQAMFDFWGYPLPSLDVWKHVYAGQSVPLAVDGLQSPTINLNLGGSLPEQVGVNYNDGTSGMIDISWDAEDVSAMLAGGIGSFTVKGTVNVVSGVGEQVLSFTVIVAAGNLVLNHSFEDGGSAPGNNWSSVGGSGQSFRLQSGATNRHPDGGNTYIDWNGAITGRALTQTISNVAPGFYTLSCWTMGDTSITTAMSVSGPTVNLETASFTQSQSQNSGWGSSNYLQRFYNNILVEATGDVTISIAITAGAWGTLDLVYFGMMNQAEAVKKAQPPLVFNGDDDIPFTAVGASVDDIVRNAFSHAGTSTLPVASGEIQYIITGGDSISLPPSGVFQMDSTGTTTVQATKPRGAFYENDAVLTASFTVTGSMSADAPIISPIESQVYGVGPILLGLVEGSGGTPETLSFSVRSGPGHTEKVADDWFLHITGAGTIILDAADDEGDALPLSIVVAPKPVTIAPTDIIVQDKAENGSDIALVSFDLSTASGFLPADLGERVGAQLNQGMWQHLPDDSGQAAKLSAWAQATFADALVGSDKSVTVSGITLGGTHRKNYVLESDTATASGNIVANPATADFPIHVRRIDGLAQDFIMGIDISTEPSLRAATKSGSVSDNIEFRNRSGDVDDIYDIFADHGVNYVRARIWHHPYGNAPSAGVPNDPTYGEGYGPLSFGAGNPDVDKAIEMGLRANAAGMRLLANFHYSDFWADPSSYDVPRAWAGMNNAQRRQALYDYTYESLEKMVLAGVDVGMVQVGNETNPGMAGAHNGNASAEMWQLIKRGCEAVNAINETYGLNILKAVHFTDPHSTNTQMEWAGYLAANDVDYDVYLLSWYPYLHGTPAQLTHTMTQISQTYGVYVGVAEVSYAPVSGGYGAFTEFYPQSNQGQANAVADAIRAVADVPDGKGIATFYWEPAWPSTSSAANANFGTGWRAAGTIGSGHSQAGSTGNSTRDTSQMFMHTGNRNPRPSMDVWRLVHSGALGTAPIAVYSVPDIRVAAVTGGDPVVMPATVEVVYNDGARIMEAIVWNQSQVDAAQDGLSGDYGVHGTITLSYLDGTTQEYSGATVVKRAANMLIDPGFDLHTAANPTWTLAQGGTISLGSVGDTAQAGNNHRSPPVGLHFSEGNSGTVSQVVNVTTPGYYNFAIWMQSDNTVNNLSRFDFRVSGPTVEGTYELTQQRGTGNWGNWTERNINNILVAAPGNVTVTLARVSSGWGALDDAFFAAMDSNITKRSAPAITGFEDRNLLINDTGVSLSASTTSLVNGGKITFNQLSGFDVITVDPDSGALTVLGEGEAVVEAHHDSGGLYESDATATATISVSASGEEPFLGGALISISPERAMLTGAALETATFHVHVAVEGTDGSQGADYRDVSFSFDDALEEVSREVNGAGASITLKAKTPIDEPKSVEVKASYKGEFHAIAAVELTRLDEGWSLAAQLLENRLTVNKAKLTGAKLPIHISTAELLETGSIRFGAANVPETGAQTVGDVALLMPPARNAPTGYDDSRRLSGYAAWMSADYRFVEIATTFDAAGWAARKQNNAEVWLLPHDMPDVADNWVRAQGTVNINVNEAYPRLSFGAAPLDLFYPELTTSISASSNDGSVSSEQLLAFRLDNKAATTDRVALVGDESVNAFQLGEAPKTGNATVFVTLDAAGAGYKRLNKSGNNEFRATIRTVNNMPKLRLAATTITLVDNGNPFGLRLQSANARIPLDDWGVVDRVVYMDGAVEVALPYGVLGDGLISIPSDMAVGRQQLRVYFVGNSERFVPLSLTIRSTKTPTLSVNPRSISWNSDMAGEHSLLNVGSNVANLGADLVVEHMVGSVANPLPGYISATSAGNQISLSMLGTAATNAELAELMETRNPRISLRISDANTPVEGVSAARTVNVTLNFTKNRTPSATLRSSGRIDVTNPAAAMNVTVTFKDTSARIADVILYDQQRAGNVIGVPSGEHVSQDFEARFTPGGNSFTIVAKEADHVNGRGYGHIVPGVRRNLSWTVILDNEADVNNPQQPLHSWSVNAKNGRVSDKPVVVNPVQGASRVVRDKSQVTLYRATPTHGEFIQLRLTAPAGAVYENIYVNARGQAALTPGQRLGFLAGGFEAVRRGHDDWTIRFEDGRTPVVGGNGRFRNNYTISLELWPEGTYRLHTAATTDNAALYGTMMRDAVGRPLPLLNGSRAATKPAAVNLRVNVK